MLKRLFVIGATAASVGAAIAYVKGRAAFRTWGVVPEEASRPLPGDDLVAEAEAIDTRGIDIAATPEEVWPWLVQMGYGRAGWYSYDELDMDHPSAERLIPELQHVKVGDVFPTHPGGGFEVKVVKPHKALVLYADRELVERIPRVASRRLHAWLSAHPLFGPPLVQWKRYGAVSLKGTVTVTGAVHVSPSRRV